jgi:hypothetical protein|tara:strand:- start:56 stop:187 length:132 start_codon:yes stop_codon:yes gene_type:complete
MTEVTVNGVLDCSDSAAESEAEEHEAPNKATTEITHPYFIAHL